MSAAVPQDGLPIRPSHERPMKLLVDARCFQDSAYVRRGIGRNTEGILRYARQFLPTPLEIVALLDPAMNEVPEDLSKLFDAVQYHVTPPHRADGPSIFYNPSPMTHSPTVLRT